MSILIIIEHHQQKLHPNAYSLVAAALKLHSEIDLLIVGKQINQVVDEATKIRGVRKVIQVAHPIYEHLLPENLAKIITEQAPKYSHIFAPASTFGKNLMPRVAALLDVAQISDVIGIESNDTFKRPMYAGNIIATVQSHDPVKVLTIRTSGFAPEISKQEACAVEQWDIIIENSQTQFIKLEESKSTRPELGVAKIVVSGGRGLQSGENFKLLEALADKLGAAIGASRAAVDAGFVPNDYQVGQTGKIVAPNLYIAIGISGAIQHLAGIKDSKIIVAINKDPDAPIFQNADFGLVGDLFQIIPEFIKALS